MSRIKNCSHPCLPWIGTHLTMIYKKQDYNKLYTEDQRRDLIKHQESELLQQQHIKSKDDKISVNSKVANVNEIEPSEDIKNHLISFSKYRLLVDFVNDLLQYQSVPYKFRLHYLMRSFLNEDFENLSNKAGNNNNNNETTDIQNIETWLFDQSKLIEPSNDKLG